MRSFTITQSNDLRAEGFMISLSAKGIVLTQNVLIKHNRIYLLVLATLYTLTSHFIRN